LGHAVGGVLAERGGDVGVALGLAELGVAEDLLHDADADALLEQERGCGVAGVMHSRGSETGFFDQGSPVFPVVAGVDRHAGGCAEDQVPVVPGRPCGEALGCLSAAVSAELGDERGGQGQHELGVALAGFDALAAGEVPAAVGALGAFAGVACAGGRARPFDLRAVMPACGAAASQPRWCLRRGRRSAIAG